MEYIQPIIDFNGMQEEIAIQQFYFSSFFFGFIAILVSYPDV